LNSIVYTPPRTLKRFMRSNAFARVAKGPVGSGKSSACIMEMVKRMREQAASPDGIRRSRGAIIRNTYRELKDTTRRTFEEWIPSLIGKWREADFTFVVDFPCGDGTSVNCEILFRSLDRPEDIRKLLSLELTFAYVNEVKELPKRVIDVLESRLGRYPSKAQGGASWFGWWGDTNPWHVGHWGQKLFKAPPPGYELYAQPGGRSESAENTENLPEGYYARLCHGKDAEWIRVFVDGEDAASDVGSIYGKLLERYNLTDFDHPRDGIYCSWDLGFTDATAIWFWRLNADGGLDFVDHYEAHGRPLSHYFDVVEGKGYAIAKHWLPHDAKADTLATGSSVQDQFLARYPGRMAIGPSLSLLDGIQAARWLLENPCRFHGRTSEGVEALRAYHYEWDDDTKSYGRKPEHDWSSHTADAFRYAALVAKFVMRISRKAASPPEPIIPPIDKSFTLDQLFQLNEQPRRKRF